MNPIIIDTDPGIDDAIALCVLSRYAKERVKLIVSSYGNVGATHTTNNALGLTELLDWDIPILEGANRSRSGEFANTTHVYGENGLGGVELSSTKNPIQTNDYLETLYQTIIEHGTVDYITLGPFTNLGQLIVRYPDVVNHIERVISMGGAIETGNIRPYAEFNLFCDSVSASEVFNKAKSISLITLNVTKTIAFSFNEINAISEQTVVSYTLKQLLLANYEACVRFGGKGSIMHDATAIIYYLFPELFATKTCGIIVDTNQQAGKTSVINDQANVTLSTSADVNQVKQKILVCIGQE